MTNLQRIVGRIYAALVKEYVPPGFRSHVFVMRVLGVWPTPDDSVWYKALTLTIFLSVGFLFPLSLFVNVCYASSIEEVIDQSFISLTCWTIACKASFIYWRQKSIRELFRIHAALLCDAVKPITDPIARQNFSAHIFLTCTYMMSWSMFLAQAAIVDPRDANWPSTSRLPYDFANRRSVYLCGLVYQSMSYLCNSICGAMEDSFYIALINMTGGHVAILKLRLRKLGASDINGYNGNMRFYRDLVECCKWYGNASRCVCFIPKKHLAFNVSWIVIY